MVNAQATVIEASSHAIDAAAEATLDLKIEVEELGDDSGYRYMATSPDLPNLIIAGDTPEEALTLVPQVAAALIASMKAKGDERMACRPSGESNSPKSCLLVCTIAGKM